MPSLLSRKHLLKECLVLAQCQLASQQCISQIQDRPSSSSMTIVGVAAPVLKIHYHKIKQY